jgi:hypothetical protein
MLGPHASIVLMWTSAAAANRPDIKMFTRLLGRRRRWWPHQHCSFTTRKSTLLEIRQGDPTAYRRVYAIRERER